MRVPSSQNCSVGISMTKDAIVFKAGDSGYDDFEEVAAKIERPTPHRLLEEPEGGL